MSATRRSLAVVAGFVLAVAARAEAAPCAHGVGDAVALQSNRGALVVAGSRGVVARFEPYETGDEPWVSGDSMARSAAEKTKSGELGRQARPPALFCTGVDGVVGIALDAREHLYVANATSVHVVDVASGAPRGAFSPALAPGEAIVALALLPSGAAELALGPSRPDPNPELPVRTRIAVYPAGSVGTHLAPVRDFVYAGFLGPVRALTIDSRGRTFADDDGGEVLVFAAGVAGEPEPRRRFAGAESGLHRTTLDAATQRQPMALDDDGDLYVVNDGRIVLFPALDDAGPQPRATANGLSAPLGNEIIRGIATGYGPLLCVLTVDPVTGAAAVRTGDGSFAPIRVP